MDNEIKQSFYLKAAISILIVISTAGFYFLSRLGLLKKASIAITKSLNVAWSIFRHWSSCLKGLLSLSLSTAEQSIFEEEFKYLIVTSSLFNGTPQQVPQQRVDSNNAHKLSQNKAENIIDNEKEFFSYSNKSLLIRVLGFSTLDVIFNILILTKFTSASQLLFPCIIPTYITTCYFLYRHHRHVQIRRIHASALDSMHKVISLSQESDAVLVLLLNNFHSFGETITNEDQQREFGALLSSHFEAYIEFVQQLRPLIDSNNLCRLREMYNVNEEIPSTLLEFDSHEYKMDDIDLIHTVIGWKRREYLLYLLALDVMSTNRRNTHYGKNWRQAIQVNTNLVKEYSQFNKKLVVIARHIDISDKVDGEMESATTISPSSSTSLLSPKDASVSSASLTSDKRSLALMHRVSAVEKYIEDIQAKLFLCKQDTKSFSSGRVSTLSLERMSKQFNLIDKNISNLLTQWKESKNALNTLLEDEQSKQNNIISLPSPPSSPRDFRQNTYDDSSTINESFGAQRSRSRSYSGGIYDSNNGVINSIRPSFSKSRLQRIQSLKTDNRIKTEPISLALIKTTSTASSAKAVSD